MQSPTAIFFNHSAACVPRARALRRAPRLTRVAVSGLHMGGTERHVSDGHRVSMLQDKIARVDLHSASTKADAMFADIDKDGDGLVTQAEFAAMYEAIKAQITTNHQRERLLKSRIHLQTGRINRMTWLVVRNRHGSPGCAFSLYRLCRVRLGGHTPDSSRTGHCSVGLSRLLQLRCRQDRITESYSVGTVWALSPY